MWISLTDSCPYHILRGCRSTLAAMELVCTWVAWGQGPEPVTHLEVLSPPRLPPRCPGPLVPRLSNAFGLVQLRLLQQLWLWPGPLNQKPGFWQLLDKINLLCTQTFLGCSRFACPIYQFPISPCRIHLQKVWKSLGGFQNNRCASRISWTHAQQNFQTCRFLSTAGSGVTHRQAHFYYSNF